MKMTRPDDDDVVTDLDEILLTDLSVGRGAARESPRLAWEEGAGQHQHQQGLGEHLHQHLKKNRGWGTQHYQHGQHGRWGSINITRVSSISRGWGIISISI